MLTVRAVFKETISENVFVFGSGSVDQRKRQIGFGGLKYGFIKINYSANIMRALAIKY